VPNTSLNQINLDQNGILRKRERNLLNTQVRDCEDQANGLEHFEKEQSQDEQRQEGRIDYAEGLLKCGPGWVAGIEEL
jgi:hypothetical protein